MWAESRQTCAVSPFALAIIAAARFGGRKPAFAATALSAPGVSHFLLAPLGSFAVAGYPEDEARRVSPNTVIAGLLQKPYTAVALAEKIAQVLEGR